MNDPMTSADWLTAVRRRAVPDRMLIEAEKLIVAKDRIIVELTERCAGQSEVLGRKAEKKEGETDK